MYRPKTVLPALKGLLAKEDNAEFFRTLQFKQFTIGNNFPNHICILDKGCVFEVSRIEKHAGNSDKPKIILEGKLYERSYFEDPLDSILINITMVAPKFVLHCVEPGRVEKKCIKVTTENDHFIAIG